MFGLGGRRLGICMAPRVREFLAPTAKDSPGGRDYPSIASAVETHFIRPRVAFYGAACGIEARARHAAQGQEAIVPPHCQIPVLPVAVQK